MLGNVLKGIVSMVVGAGAAILYLKARHWKLRKIITPLKPPPVTFEEIDAFYRAIKTDYKIIEEYTDIPMHIKPMIVHLQPDQEFVDRQYRGSTPYQLFVLHKNDLVPARQLRWAKW
jgi:hypothetical protein